MKTRPSSAATNIIQDAKQLVARAKSELPAILKADKARGKTAGTNMDTVKKLAADIAAFEKASTVQGGKATTAKASTSNEVAARQALAAELKSIRQDVTDAAPTDVALQKAFGRGKNLESNTTNTLLDAADLVSGSFEARAVDVKTASVTQARMTKVAKLRAKLADADAAQRGALGDKAGATGGKKVLLASIKSGLALLRRRLGKAPGGSKKAVKSTSPRRAVKKRPPKPTT
jgi:hypothetical protein